jgi:hypothetical protein
MPSQWPGSTTEKSPALTARIARSSAFIGSISELDFAPVCARSDFVDTATGETSLECTSACTWKKLPQAQDGERAVQVRSRALRLRLLRGFQAVEEDRVVVRDRLAATSANATSVPVTARSFAPAERRDRSRRGEYDIVRRSVKPGYFGGCTGVCCEYHACQRPSA